jgi:hypothetical protein
MRLLSILLICLFGLSIQAQDSVYLKVHFLYGSKPKKRYQDSEPKWFGGILGGHVGIEGDTNEVVIFMALWVAAPIVSKSWWSIYPYRSSKKYNLTV